MGVVTEQMLFQNIICEHTLKHLGCCSKGRAIVGHDSGRYTSPGSKPLQTSDKTQHLHDQIEMYCMSCTTRVKGIHICCSPDIQWSVVQQSLLLCVQRGVIL